QLIPHLTSLLPLNFDVGSYCPLMRDKEIKNTKPKDLPIYGIVVTGKTEDLQSLQGSPYIKAAVRGVTVEKY
ncbi:anti sigma factor C-terminal domain-containing protein, partial [Bacillus thuringiensis]|nr:anti sigma factor C-terminal domain-containing protein [Bacillus thuringiensis]